MFNCFRTSTLLLTAPSDVAPSSILQDSSVTSYTSAGHRIQQHITTMDSWSCDANISELVARERRYITPLLTAKRGNLPQDRVDKQKLNIKFNK